MPLPHLRNIFLPCVLAPEKSFSNVLGYSGSLAKIAHAHLTVGIMAARIEQPYSLARGFGSSDVLPINVQHQANLEQATAKLTMGAFGHSLWRQFVLGGVTETMLRDAVVPVFMSH
jgi:predicted alpha/beta-hydrolase family hydrolase